MFQYLIKLNQKERLEFIVAYKTNDYYKISEALLFSLVIDYELRIKSKELTINEDSIFSAFSLYEDFLNNNRFYQNINDYINKH